MRTASDYDVAISLPPPPPAPAHGQPGDSGLPCLPEEPHAPLFRETWKLRARRQRWAGWSLLGWFLVALVGVVVAIAGALDLPPRVALAVFPLFFLPVLFHSLFTMINYRCPRCNKGLSRIRHPRFCFNCGLRLRD